MPFVESINEFSRRHGGQSVEVGGLLHFPDGATCEAGTAGGGARMEPPRDAFERQKLIVRYWEALATRAAQAFQDAKQNLLDMTRGYQRGLRDFPPPPTEHERVVQLQQQARQLRSRLIQERQKLDQLTPEEVWQKEAKRAARAAHGAKLAEQVKKLNL